jgi:ribosomal-protein-alanine N-acetyltransferase
MNTEFKPLARTNKDDVWELYKNEAVREFLGGAISETDFAIRFKKLLEDQGKHWCIFSGSVFVGICSLTLHHESLGYEVSYQILPAYWGKGVGIESINFVLTQAKNRKLTSVLAETQIKNIKSVKLLERSGFKLIKTLSRFEVEQSLYEFKI